MNRLLLFLSLLCMPWVARGQSAYECVYWYDSDDAPRFTGTSQDPSFSIDADVSGLSEGVHTIHLQVADETGRYSPSITQFFVRPIDLEGTITCICSVDEQLVAQKSVPATGGIINWNLDVNSLSVGLHRAVFQAITSAGAASTIAERYFVRIITEQDLAGMKCVYALDGHDTYVAASTMGDGLFHFDFDVASLENGLHRVAYMMVTEQGVATPQRSAFFWKTPLGGTGIESYTYWLNDDGPLHSTTLTKREDPYKLIELLPVEHMPLRSSCFHFEVVNGQPTIYAKNDLHLRFYDSSTRFVDESRQYVDYEVSQPVTDITQLESGVKQTTERLAENSIKWYKLQAQPGDSLSFRLDRAATLQGFAPSGNEVFSVSGSASVRWCGAHAEETGTYYVALHDVTATQGTTISLDYERIDRYAVLRQDVTTVGNGGPSTITFQGNGFDELTSADLVLGSTTIASTEIKAEGKAAVSVKWDFTDVPTGQYKAVFHFKEGDVTVEKCITVEEAVPVTVSSTVSYASQFLVSTGNTYNYKVRNRGNMTAYDVPMTLTVYASDSLLLQRVEADGVELAEYAPADTLKEGYAYARRYQLTRTLRPSTKEPLAVRVKTGTTGHIYVDLDGVGGPSEAVTAIDPNDIYGYQDEQGDRTIRDGRTQVYYTIEFENDPEFATASAHEIRVTDVLSPELFDLSTFAPTRIKIGDKEAELSGEKNGLVTIDMRSEINAIAQVEWTFDEATGTAHWHISSLDPQTMEPTDDPMDGVLPVNAGGNGIGQLSFDISLKPGLPDGTEIPNRATIVFDDNEGIETPTWVNTISSMLKGDITFGYGFTDKDIAPDVTFTVRVVSAHSIVLDETSIAPPATATGVNVTVKRTINAGEWTTICLPFALNGEQMVEAFGEGVQVADFTAWSSEEDSEGDITRITLDFETVTEMEANHPYIINVAEDITEFTLDGVDISPEEEPSVQVGKKKAERGFLTGTYVVADVPEEGLVLDGGQFAYSDGTRQTVAFSAYFELADALTDTETAAACIDIVLDGESITTAIGTAMDSTGVKGTAFTLDGIRVSKAVKGLYIQDGRIVLKK